MSIDLCINLRYFIWFNAAVTLLLRNLLLLDSSSFTTVVPIGSLVWVRWLLTAGLLIIVITKRSSDEDGELLADRFDVETFRNEDEVGFGLFDTTKDDEDDVDEGVKDRSWFEDVDLALAISGVSRCVADLARWRGLMKLNARSSSPLDIFVFDALKNMSIGRKIDQFLFIFICLRHAHPTHTHHISNGWFVETFDRADKTTKDGAGITIQVYISCVYDRCQSKIITNERTNTS